MSDKNFPPFAGRGRGGGRGSGRGGGRGAGRGGGRGAEQEARRGGERGGGRGAGRGAGHGQRQEPQPGQSRQNLPPETTRQTAAPPPATGGGWSSIVSGRLSAPAAQPSAKVAPPRTPAPSSSGSGNGNAVVRSSDQSRGSRRGNRAITDIVVTKPKNLNTKMGNTGEKIRLIANYYKLIKSPGWNIYKYRVDFSPDIELLTARKKLMRRQIPTLGSFQFDGTVIFSLHKYATDPMILMDKSEIDESPIQITIRYVGELLPTHGEYIHLLNLIMKQTIESLGMQRAYGPKGAKYFDPQQMIDVRQHNLQIWPGFSTSIRQHESDIMICAEVTHKVIRMENCYNVMARMGNNRDSMMRELIGQVVVTEYNNATYRIDDMDFTRNPTSEFQMKSGEMMSFLQYFQNRYKCTIRDLRQPLLVSRAKAKDIRAGRAETILLVPELCRLTGLTKEHRANMGLMRDLANHTRIGPSMRVQRFVELNRRIQEEPRAQAVMDKWNMTLDRQLVELMGRVLPRENICFGGGKMELPNEADWTNALKKNSLFESQPLTNWHVICPERDLNVTTKFISMLKSTAQRAHFNMQDPRVIRISDDFSRSYVANIEKACNDSTQMVVCVVPNQREDRYIAIKRKCYVERAVPSQCLWTRKLTNDKILGGMVVKVMIQMSCKLGNAPWTVKIPLKRVMNVGFDVTFDPNDKSKSFGAFVATMDLAETNTYYSSVSQHKHGEEMSNFLLVNMMKALKQFVSIHQAPPGRIIFYRDGVGDGDLDHVREYEVKKLISDLKSAYGEMAPRLTFIIVSKRINTRLFQKVRNIDNPPPGTVVDDVITLPERYDFFLVSQSTRQGTISPTSYNVIWDESGLSPDKIQMWTYKMTHLYYNWSGNVKVPMVCQYAQKLALLVGQYLRTEPSHLLEKKLYFL
ncbi:hypothetical protein DMENIID0001_010860 [Sergentomyia squamirostris]